ncbi:MAG: cation:proton antiporter [Pseudomonadota bacterium]
MLKDRGELNSEYGSQSFSILLFQDLAVIPLLAAVPLVAGASMGEDWGFLALKAGGVLVALVVIGVFVLDRVFRLVASSGSREAFAATALFVVALTSVAVSWAGLSMALGAFLAGALLADSAYRRQIETDIEPFRGLLLGLFFISIGMRLDMEVIAEYWWVIVGGAIGLLTVKSVLLFLLAKSFGSNTRDSAKTAAVLSQGGEFAFVVLSLGVGEAVFTNQQATLMSAIVTISMALTPLAMMLANRSFRDNEADSEEGLEGPGSGRDHVIIVGFGRMGQIISQVLQNSGVAVTAIDRNPPRIRNAERFGYKVFYGDGSRLDVLLTAGALEARAVVFCMDDRKATSSAVAALRERCPTVTIVSVAHDRVHEIELQALGPDVIVRQTLESSLVMARETLRHMGFDEAIIDDFVDQFRESDRERLLAQIDAGVDAATHLIHQPYSARGDSGRNR